MRSDWIKSTISDICSLVTDGSHFSPKSVDAGKFMVSVKDFTYDGFDFTSCRQISEKDYMILEKNGCVPEYNDILIGKDGARFFEDIVIYRQSERPALLSSIAILRCNMAKVIPEFLYYTLKTPDFRADVRDNYGSGSAIPRIILKDFKRMPVLLPPIEVQRVISDTLSCLDARIALNKKINHHLEQMAQAIFKSWFVDFEPFDGVMPDDWQVGHLTDIADYLNGLAMQRFRPTESEVGMPVLKIKELRQGSCDAQSELCSPNVRSDYIVHDGDVIFSWSGSLLVDFWCGGDCGLNQHLFKVTSRKYDKWFYYAWTCHHLARFITMAADKATTMGHIKREALENAEVIIPDGDSYRQLGGLLTPLYEQIINNRVESRKLSLLRDALLPRLMSGELSVSDLDDAK
ncbi:restriction endonuclease subunit S [Anaerotruncus massiliensis (ex Togo et al. 2019)]|uniref:restriction endonuclease subunit S n=1 Tax=Anaerotruncus TaxID=244127 RepID=UPI000C77E78E|nr:restriction endonuclease subunit S [Anaerotruncus massiliensis (ex Togo et al. 2019)]